MNETHLCQIICLLLAVEICTGQYMSSDFLYNDFHVGPDNGYTPYVLVKDQNSKKPSQARTDSILNLPSQSTSANFLIVVQEGGEESHKKGKNTSQTSTTLSYPRRIESHLPVSRQFIQFRPPRLSKLPPRNEMKVYLPSVKTKKITSPATTTPKENIQITRNTSRRTMTTIAASESTKITTEVTPFLPKFLASFTKKSLNMSYYATAKISPPHRYSISYKSGITAEDHTSILKKQQVHTKIIYPERSTVTHMIEVTSPLKLNRTNSQGTSTTSVTPYTNRHPSYIRKAYKTSTAWNYTISPMRNFTVYRYMQTNTPREEALTESEAGKNGINNIVIKPTSIITVSHPKKYSIPVPRSTFLSTESNLIDDNLQKKGTTLSFKDTLSVTDETSIEKSNIVDIREDEIQLKLPFYEKATILDKYNLTEDSFETLYNLAGENISLLERDLVDFSLIDDLPNEDNQTQFHITNFNSNESSSFEVHTSNIRFENFEKSRNHSESPATENLNSKDVTYLFSKRKEFKGILDDEQVVSVTKYDESLFDYYNSGRNQSTTQERREMSLDSNTTKINPVIEYDKHFSENITIGILKTMVDSTTPVVREYSLSSNTIPVAPITKYIKNFSANNTTISTTAESRKLSKEETNMMKNEKEYLSKAQYMSSTTDMISLTGKIIPTGTTLLPFYTNSNPLRPAQEINWNNTSIQQSTRMISVSPSSLKQTNTSIEKITSKSTASTQSNNFSMLLSELPPSIQVPSVTATSILISGSTDIFTTPQTTSTPNTVARNQTVKMGDNSSEYSRWPGSENGFSINLGDMSEGETSLYPKPPGRIGVGKLLPSMKGSFYGKMVLTPPKDDQLSREFGYTRFKPPTTEPNQIFDDSYMDLLQKDDVTTRMPTRWNVSALPLQNLMFNADGRRDLFEWQSSKPKFSKPLIKSKYRVDEGFDDFEEVGLSIPLPGTSKFQKTDLSRKSNLKSKIDFDIKIQPFLHKPVPNVIVTDRNHQDGVPAKKDEVKDVLDDDETFDEQNLSIEAVDKDKEPWSNMREIIEQAPETVVDDSDAEKMEPVNTNSEVTETYLQVALRQKKTLSKYEQAFDLDVCDSVAKFMSTELLTLTGIKSQLRHWSRLYPSVKYYDIARRTPTEGNHSIYMMVVNDTAKTTYDKKIVHILAGISGNDYNAISAALKVADEIVRSKALLKKFIFMIVPLLNPDGFLFSKASPNHREWRKNIRPVSKHCFGVNLDRNFEYQWQDDLLLDPCSDLYPGVQQLTEVETRSLASYLLRYKGSVDIFIAIKEGPLFGVFFPYSHSKKKRLDYTVFKSYADKAAMAATQTCNKIYVAGQKSHFFPLYAGGVAEWAESHLGAKLSFDIMIDASHRGVATEVLDKEVMNAIFVLLDVYNNTEAIQDAMEANGCVDGICQNIFTRSIGSIKVEKATTSAAGKVATNYFNYLSIFFISHVVLF